MRAFAYLFLIALVTLEVIVVWRPYDTHTILYDAGLSDNKPAGQIVRHFHLTQTVPIHKLLAGRAVQSLDCFALRFATYRRKNTGAFSVRWQQQNRAHVWRVEAASLRDNTYVDFCPDGGINTQHPFQIDIQGLDGTSGHAATVWMTGGNPIPATINGTTSSKRGVSLRLTRKHHVRPLEILQLSKGAFAFGCFVSLVIGMLALTAMLPRYRDTSAGG
jgi:hypothetical protein